MEYNMEKITQKYTEYTESDRPISIDIRSKKTDSPQ